MEVIYLIVVLVLLILLLAAVLIWFRRRRQAAGEAPTAAKPAAKPKAGKPAGANEPAPSPSQPTAPAPAARPASAPAAPGRPAAPAAQPAKPRSPADLQEKIRILIVDDNPGTRENVSRLLYFEKDMEVIGQAVNGRHGIEMVIQHKPHIVLMDINMPDMDGITATREMSLKAPFSQVIIMSVQAEQHYMRQAMTAGARDFQPKPFTSEELTNCIRRVYTVSQSIYQQFEAAERAEAILAAQPKATPEPGERGGVVIAVYSPKGGTGTSTIAANLAVALQQEFGDIVLMDGDLQFGDVLVHLNTKATHTISDLIYEGQFDIELLPDVTLAHNSGLKLLLAPVQPELADAVTPAMLSEVIKSLRQHYKVVVIDTDSHLGDKTMSVIDAADYILVVMVPELPAIKSTKLFLEIAQQLEFDSSRLAVVLNRVGIPGGIAPEKIEKALKLSGSHRIPDDPRLHMAINKGVAVTQQDMTAPSAQALLYLARDVWQKAGERRSTPVAPEVA